MKNGLISLSLFLLFGCTKAQKKAQNKVDMKQYEHTNELIHETSPYLLQHAHNPVNWMPWNEKTLAKAKAENKPLIISIGYSACHWCHVMEHESFEDSTIAALMNENFICIKVDREERPDVDQVYMNAVQLMTGRGGWPLNCFATSDGRPFFGGTYFPKDKWKDILIQLAEVVQTDPAKIEAYANQLTEGIRSSDLIEKIDSEKEFNASAYEEGLEGWKRAFDSNYGGNNKAPKFPIPSNLDFLMRHYYHTKDELIKNHLDLTLEKMAYGGIYDQIGGGFARYSTDLQWKVPHFEKMLYDNAQLVSLYSKGYQLNKNPLYKQVVFETINFISEEFTAKNGAFYSALDADSEGEEGKYYVWKKAELQTILGSDFKLFKEHFNINSFGFWEHDNYVLIRNKSSEELASKAGMSLANYEDKINKMRLILKKERDKRVKPGLDDKSLTSWNALMIVGLVDAYLTFGEPKHLQMALKNARFIEETQLKKDFKLWHSYKDGRSTISGYLEDYSFVMEAFIAIYEATGEEKWLQKAKGLADYSISNFYDQESGMFFFTDKNDPALIARKFEVSDNVIPASNSSMANALHLLGIYFEKSAYQEKSDQMLRNVAPKLNSYLPGYSNWAKLLLNRTAPFYEVVITGKNAKELLQELEEDYLPNKIILLDENGTGKLPLLELKWTKGRSTIYICENKVCQLPVDNAREAKQQILTE